MVEKNSRQYKSLMRSIWLFTGLLEEEFDHQFGAKKT
jgi:hypothetical protein